ncbi:MAG: helicase-exonuclease AddAB subunit AddA [Lachnospiraceae bacterium]|nr:helicase-exonuclease AddAB subunit AddA [Lachnospiraceae bacterium]
MNWTEDQRKIIDARNGNLLVSAAAGSGKTAVLVERIIQMISDKEDPVDIDALLVVTFTKVAAAQMKDKIAQAIERMLEKDPSNEHYLKQMNYINHANILTIDSFCYQVVKEHFHILGIDPGIRIGDTGEIGLLREEVLEEVIEDFYRDNKAFVTFSDAFSADKKDDRIEDYILKVYDVSASYPRPEEWTRQAREALHVETEADFLELNFVKQYMDEVHSTAEGIRNRIVNALAAVRDIDGPFYMEKALLSDIQLADDLISAKTYSQFHDLQGQKYVNIGRGKKGTYDEEIAERIKKQRDEYKKQINSLLEVFAIPFDVVLSQFRGQEAMLTALLEITDAFRERFLQAKLQKGILEFSDVEHFALKVLCRGYNTEGDPVPSEIGKELSESYKEILIDEYQDSNYLQEAILKCVSTVWQEKYNIFMVGDVKQSIYSFRMARPDLFMDKYHTYGTEDGAACRKLLLKNNFRSRANVLESINYIFYQIMGSDLGGIDYTKDEALVPGREFPETEDDSVELLIGESKDFDFLNLQDEEMSSEKDENLNEELEDIGRMELEASIVAGRIEQMMGVDGGSPFQVVDEESGGMRDVRFEDMVILFRAPSGFQQVFSETLMSRNIPVKVQNESGYFDTVEIRLLLSLLRVVDNPYNDIEVAAVLRSCFGKLGNDELAVLAMVKKGAEQEMHQKLYLYQAVTMLAEYWERKRKEKADGEEDSEKADFTWLERLLEDSLSDDRAFLFADIGLKCQNFVKLVKRLQEQKSYATIGQMINSIYYDIGYYYYTQAMPEGRQRVRNLNLFLGETRRFEDGPFQSVFDFLRYVDKLQEKAIVLGGDPAPESSEDVVRIMSIHRSKGLEFPVIFLAGMGRNFNRMDTKTPLIIHPDFFLGAKYVDTNERCGNDTFSRKAFASLMVTESIAEELRIFYVGLTRAKEKLIMTGVTPDLPALVKRYEEAALRKETQLSYSVVHTARNYLDLVVASLMRNEVFGEAMKKVRKRMDKKQEAVISAEYEQPFVLRKPQIRLKVEAYDFRGIAVHHIQSNLDKQLDRTSVLKAWMDAPAAQRERIEENLSWNYADQFLTLQKSKLSVTEIKRIYETDYEPSDVIERPAFGQEAYTAPIPYFLSGDKPMDAAEKGTWMHKAMELLDFAGVESREQVRESLETMWREERIPEETRSFITEDKIYALVTSPLGNRMRRAARNGLLFKEKKFVIGVPAKRLLGETGEEDAGNLIVVQGIVDACFREGDHLILLDYKTDHVKEGQEELLLQRYKTQLLYYKDTLEQLTGLTVSETYLYSFALDKELRFIV